MLACMIDSCVASAPPAVVTSATEEYLEDEIVFLAWVNERSCAGPAGRDPVEPPLQRLEAVGRKKGRINSPRA
jgi:hypothetical protein